MGEKQEGSKEIPNETECGAGRRLCSSLEVCGLLLLLGLYSKMFWNCLVLQSVWRTKIVGTEAKGITEDRHGLISEGELWGVENVLYVGIYTAAQSVSIAGQCGGTQL